MTSSEIKKTWKDLLIPFCIGIIALLVGVLWNNFGSKKAVPQTLSLFLGVFGLVFVAFSGLKILKFKKYLNSQSSNAKK